jgi:hypothetical protein
VSPEAGDAPDGGVMPGKARFNLLGHRRAGACADLVGEPPAALLGRRGRRRGRSRRRRRPGTRSRRLRSGNSGCRGLRRKRHKSDHQTPGTIRARPRA